MCIITRKLFFFLEATNHMDELLFLHNYEKKKTYVIPLSTARRYLILLYMK